MNSNQFSERQWQLFAYRLIQRIKFLTFAICVESLFILVLLILHAKGLF